VISALNLFFLLVVLFSFGEELIFGVPLLIRVVLVIPIITSILTVVLLILTVISWVGGYWSLFLLSVCILLEHARLEILVALKEKR